MWPLVERSDVGAIPHPRPAYRDDAGAYPIERPAPTLGQHTREVLTELLGLGAAELDDLEQRGVIGEVPAL